jgi:phosphohistidine phosphatase
MSTKRLYLLRHAHSPSLPGVKDMDRELSAKGNDQAAALGQYMKCHNFVPDMVLCSSSHRTRKTLDGVLQSMNIVNIKYLPILYVGSVGEYLTQIQECDECYESILLVAHNPSIYGLAALLAKTHNEILAQRLATGGYAPATLCVLDVPVNKWAHIQPHKCPLLHIADPTDYHTPR